MAASRTQSENRRGVHAVGVGIGIAVEIGDSIFQSRKAIPIPTQMVANESNKTFSCHAAQGAPWAPEGLLGKSLSLKIIMASGIMPEVRTGLVCNPNTTKAPASSEFDARESLSP